MARIPCVPSCLSITQHFGDTSQGNRHTLLCLSSRGQHIGQVDDSDTYIHAICADCLYKGLLVCTICLTHQAFHPITIHSVMKPLLRNRNQQTGKGDIGIIGSEKICLENNAERPHRKTIALTIKQPIDSRLAAQPLCLGEGVFQSSVVNLLRVVTSIAQEPSSSRELSR